MHEILRNISMQAWQDLHQSLENPMEKLIYESDEIKKYFKKEEIKKLLDVKGYIGNAAKKSLTIAKKIANLS